VTVARVQNLGSYIASVECELYNGTPSGVQERQSPWSIDQAAKRLEDESFIVLGRTPNQGVTYAPSRYFANSSVTYRRLSEDKVNSIEKIVTESSDNVCGPSYSGKFSKRFCDNLRIHFGDGWEATVPNCPSPCATPIEDDRGFPN